MKQITRAWQPLLSLLAGILLFVVGNEQVQAEKLEVANSGLEDSLQCGDKPNSCKIVVADNAEKSSHLLYFPPPLEIEPLVPRILPEDELERDPGGILVLPNVRVNPSPGSCFENGTANKCAQNETTIAVNPTDHDNWVGGANDYSGSIILNGRAQSSCGFYFSKDAGQTWEGELLPTQPGFTGGGDPSVAFDSNGNAYYACLNFELEGEDSDLGDSGIFVFKSQDGGKTYPQKTLLISGSGPNDFHDKEYITVDPDLNNVYASWVHKGKIRFAGSDDGVATFTAPAPGDDVFVNDPGNNSNQGPVVVARSIINIDLGIIPEVYVAWLADPGSTKARILFDRSNDGGNTFNAFGGDVTVEGNVTQFPFRQTGAGTGISTRTTLIGEHGDPVDNPKSAFRVNSFPSMDICRNPDSPFFGHLYLVFADNRFEDGDIFFKRSEDGGETWPGGITRRINDDPIRNGKDQFFPWLSVDENCKINVSFYDRRDDPDNLKFHLYFSHSTDGGETFSPNARVTTAPSTNAQFKGGFIGDYLQNKATVATLTTFHHDLDRAVALWMDTREGGQDAFAATVLQTQGGTWVNVDVNLVVPGPATDLDFVFPGDVTDKFSSFYHGDQNPFKDHDVSFNAGDNETTLSFIDPQPGPLNTGDLAHVGFVFEGNPQVVQSFWTGSSNIGSIPMGSLDFEYNPITQGVKALLCNDRQDGISLNISAPEFAVLDTPLELEELNASDLPAALAVKEASLTALPPPASSVNPGSCVSFPIPDPVKVFEAVLLTATLTFSGDDQGNRVVLFAQKVAKDAEVPSDQNYKCYFGKQIPPFTEDNPRFPFPTIDRVTLNDQFASRETDVRFLKGLCNPAGKNAPVNTERKDHLSCYSISDVPGQPLFFPGLIGEIQIETQNFGADTVKLGHALDLCVSASKNGQFADIGDFKCYSARSSAQRDFPEITLDDQFFANKPATIERLSRFCTPVGKNQPAPPEDPEAFDHLACYDIGRDRLQPQINVNLTDQFIEGTVGENITFTAEFERRFCEPARKISVQPRRVIPSSIE